MQHYSTAEISIGGKRCKAILADSFVKRAIGLMFRECLDKDACMLFISKGERDQSVTMCNMLFPLDILWLDGKQKIIHIEQNVAPGGRFAIFKTYGPSRGSQYVIELNAGFARKNRISKTTKIRLIEEK
jgi:uncharacterized membrane protein (UPF0127 family)